MRANGFSTAVLFVCLLLCCKRNAHAIATYTSSCSTNHHHYHHHHHNYKLFDCEHVLLAGQGRAELRNLRFSSSHRRQWRHYLWFPRHQVRIDYDANRVMGTVTDPPVRGADPRQLSLPRPAVRHATAQRCIRGNWCVIKGTINAI